MNPFTALTSKIFGGLAIVLLIAVAVQTVRLSSAQEALETKRNELAAEQARHAVTRQSVDTLDAVIADLNERSLARAEAYAEGQAVAAKRAADLAESRQQSEKQIAELRKAAREQVNGDCPVPDDIRALAESL